MSYLYNIARPGLNAFQPLFCVKCGAMVGIRTGGGLVTDDGSDDEIEARVKVHAEFHDRIDPIEGEFAEVQEQFYLYLEGRL